MKTHSLIPTATALVVLATLSTVHAASDPPLDSALYAATATAAYHGEALPLNAAAINLLAAQAPSKVSGEEAMAAATGEPGAGDTTSLAEKTQNPISDLVSLPLQNNFNFKTGAAEGLQWIMNVQPVIPVTLNENWNLINRAILPVIAQEELFPGTGSKSGIGDLQYTPFFTPNTGGDVVWGVGPVFQFPTASDDLLGTGKWNLGPSAVLVATPGRWVVGALAQNVWSVGGDSDRANVNTFLFQYFVNYNFDDGWYLSSAPINTANWEADEKWTVPLGGGFGRVFSIGKQPMNAQLQAFKNVVSPENAADWQLRFQLQFLFPK